MTETPRLNRRLLVLRVAALGAVAAVLPTDAGAQGSKGGRGTGLTDSDPNDGAGNGRGGYRPRSGVTDNDPNDGAGNGRGGYRVAPRTGITDNDPNDGAGNGRGGYRGRSVTDSDPSDGAGRGRGYR